MLRIRQRLEGQLENSVFVGLALLHIALTGWLTFRYSPTQNEVAHLPAGIVIWKYQDFSLYRVNPPLVRAVAALPVLVTPYKEDWTWYRRDADLRHEWSIGRDFMVANGPASLWLMTLARWACLPFSLLGMWVCYRWGTQLTTRRGGLAAAALWAFSPNTLSHGALITPDIAATSFGLLAAWRFSSWLRQTTIHNAFLAGVTLGLALLTKSTWIILLGIWPVLMIVNCLWAKSARPRMGDLGQIVLILSLGLYLLNLGYLFNGTGTPLGDYRFYSAALSGEPRIPGENLPGNRFSDSWLGKLPVPAPKDYITGIDLQKVDFEQGQWSYFWGEVKDPGGWPQYYLIGLFLKVPLGCWLAFGLGLWALSRNADARASARQLLPLIIPAFMILIIASWQTNMNRHLRYVFPLLPVIYLVTTYSIQKSAGLAVIFILTSITSSLSVYPYSLSFFNYSIGGPNSGSQYFIASNLDWGQDLNFVRDWLDDHPDARPAWIGNSGNVALEVLGIDARPVAHQPQSPGWYIISRSQRFHPDQRLQRFVKLKPIDQIGYSFDVIRIPQPVDAPMNIDAEVR